MGKKTLQFWFEFASTYSYLSVMRIESLAEQAGITLQWKPFLLGPIFKNQGWDTSPFNIYKNKGKYMWKDIQRKCNEYGIPFKRPSIFPQNGLLAARVSILISSEKYLPEFVKSVFLANFSEGKDIFDLATISFIIDSIGQDGDKLIEYALTSENKERLRKQTEEAGELGIFGAPTFIADNELFWGNDRLEDAINLLLQEKYST